MMCTGSKLKIDKMRAVCSNLRQALTLFSWKRTSSIPVITQEDKKELSQQSQRSRALIDIFSPPNIEVKSGKLVGSRLLNLLNTASVTQLQLLQSVGVKRARAIFDWRELHGHFNFINELQQVPGFTDKFIQKLLQNQYSCLTDLINGFRLGETTVITGRHKVGKTTFTSQMAMELISMGMKTIWWDCRATPKDFAYLMELTKYQFFHSHNKIWRESFQCDTSNPLKYLYCIPASKLDHIKPIVQVIESLIIDKGIQHVVIDHSHTLRARKFTIIQESKKLAVKFNCHVTVVVTPHKARFPGEDKRLLNQDTAFHSPRTIKQADNLLIINEAGKYPARYVQVAKNVNGGNLKCSHLRFIKQYLSYRLS